MINALAIALIAGIWTCEAITQGWNWPLAGWNSLMILLNVPYVIQWMNK